MKKYVEDPFIVCMNNGHREGCPHPQLFKDDWVPFYGRDEGITIGGLPAWRLNHNYKGELDINFAGYAFGFRSQLRRRTDPTASKRQKQLAKENGGLWKPKTGVTTYKGKRNA